MCNQRIVRESEDLKYPERRDQEKKAALARRDTDRHEHFQPHLFPDKAEEIRGNRAPVNTSPCTMCGDFCAMEGGISLFQRILAKINAGNYRQIRKYAARAGGNGVFTKSRLEEKKRNYRDCWSWCFLVILCR